MSNTETAESSGSGEVSPPTGKNVEAMQFRVENPKEWGPRAIEIAAWCGGLVNWSKSHRHAVPELPGSVEVAPYWWAVRVAPDRYMSMHYADYDRWVAASATERAAYLVVFDSLVGLDECLSRDEVLTINPESDGWNIVDALSNAGRLR